MLESIKRYKINSLMVVPPQLVLLCKVDLACYAIVRTNYVKYLQEPIVKNFDLSNIRMVLSAGSPLAGKAMIFLVATSWVKSDIPHHVGEILDQVIELLPQAYIGQAYGLN